MARRRNGEPLQDLRALIQGADPTVCLDWPWAIHPEGYGIVCVHSKWRKVHQVVLEIEGHSRPSPLHEVRHLCGRKACCNPHHLQWGTKSENQRDRYRLHGDNNRGERNSRHRLTADQVREIRRLRELGVGVKEVAARFGVSRSNVSMITTGRTWESVA